MYFLKSRTSSYITKCVKMRKCTLIKHYESNPQTLVRCQHVSLVLVELFFRTRIQAGVTGCVSVVMSL